MTHLLIGLAKGVVFGVLVGITGCHRGLTAARSAEGVGNATTSAVVSGILQIIVADAIFAVVLHILNI
jgi:phospholipid/cholesterol/gamma-HCH transport system permease protein